MNELTVLLVEDNDDDRFLTIRAMRKLAIPLVVEIARNGDEALKRLQNGALDPRPVPSFVLLDLQMPKLGGIHLLRRLRELYPAPQLPVVILSSSDSPTDLAACRELGADGYLSKPLAPRELEDLLAALGLAP
jgi:CheY-like chemotaxis protein